MSGDTFAEPTSWSEYSDLNGPLSAIARHSQEGEIVAQSVRAVARQLDSEGF